MDLGSPRHSERAGSLDPLLIIDFALCQTVGHLELRYQLIDHDPIPGRQGWGMRVPYPLLIICSSPLTSRVGHPAVTIPYSPADLDANPPSRNTVRCSSVIIAWNAAPARCSVAAMMASRSPSAVSTSTAKREPTFPVGALFYAPLEHPTPTAGRSASPLLTQHCVPHRRRPSLVLSLVS
jgi:hypothetical protein